MKRTLKTIAWIIKVDIAVGKRFVAWRLFHAALQGVIPLVTTYLTARLLAQVALLPSQQVTFEAAMLSVIYLLAIEVGSQLLYEFNSYIEEVLRNRSFIRVNKQMFDKIYDLSQEQFEDEAFNTKLARSRDTLYSMQRFTTDLAFALSDLTRFIGGIVALLIIQPAIALIVLIGIVPVAVVNIRQNKAFEEVYNKAERYDRIAFRTRWMLIDPQFMSEIRLANAFKQLVSVWRTNMEKAQSIELAERRKQSWLQVLLAPIDPVIQSGAVLYFLKMLAVGNISLERFIFIRGMLQQTAVSITSVVRSFDRLHTMTLDLMNFVDIHETSPAIPNGNMPVSLPLSIEFRNVSFRYPNTKEYVLNDISFVIQSNSKLALVGENGAGKSTFIKLLLRQYLPTKGEILVNGILIQDVDFESYFAHIASLSQDFFLPSHLTLQENLELGLDESQKDKDRIQESLVMADADKIVNKLPKKLESRMDTSFKNGVQFSGGQQQRIAIARAINRRASLLILDEPTSAIDAKAEHKIFQNIFTSHATGATLIVSHRFSTIRRADGIIVLENGRVQAYGAHEELLKHGGLYKEMFEKQAEGYR